MSAALLLAWAAAASGGEAWPPEVPAWVGAMSPARARAPAPPAECPPGSAAGAGEEPLFSVKTLRPLPPGAFPVPVDDLDAASAVLAARRTRDYWLARPASEAVAVGDRSYPAAHMARAGAALAEVLSRGLAPEELRAELESRFDLFQAEDARGRREGTITAYYDPVLEVSREPAAERFPLHARPADLERAEPGSGFDYGRRGPDGRLIPHFARAEISRGALEGRGLERLWTRHPTDALVLHTQGSGWGLLPDGARVRLAFDGANGHPFRSVGSALIRCGLVPPGTGSLEILAYLKSRSPARERELVDLNPRYVFLKEMAGAGGPWGAGGVELVAGRSVAVDPSELALGLPAFLVSRKPVADEEGVLRGYRDFSRFVFTHDVGAAIRGPVRVDVFWGAGRRAAAEAHRMKAPGRLYVAVLKE